MRLHLKPNLLQCYIPLNSIFMQHKTQCLILLCTDHLFFMYFLWSNLSVIVKLCLIILFMSTSLNSNYTHFLNRWSCVHSYFLFSIFSWKIHCIMLICVCTYFLNVWMNAHYVRILIFCFTACLIYFIWSYQQSWWRLCHFWFRKKVSFLLQSIIITVLIIGSCG